MRPVAQSCGTDDRQTKCHTMPGAQPTFLRSTRSHRHGPNALAQQGGSLLLEIALRKMDREHQTCKIVSPIFFPPKISVLLLLIALCCLKSVVLYPQPTTTPLFLSSVRVNDFWYNNTALLVLVGQSHSIAKLKATADWVVLRSVLHYSPFFWCLTRTRQSSV